MVFLTVQAVLWKKIGENKIRGLVVWCHEQENILSSSFNLNLSLSCKLETFLRPWTKLFTSDSNTRVRIDWLTSVMNQSPIFKVSGHLFSPYFTFSYNLSILIFYLLQWILKMCSFLEGDSQNMRMLTGRFKTTSNHFFANCLIIFYKTEVCTVI